MHFMIVGFDGTDDGAPARRQAARANHLEVCAKLKEAGKLPYAVALLSEEDPPRMIGSVMILSCDSRAAVDSYLSGEPYVTGQVWQRIEVRPVQPGPAYLSPT